MFFFKRTTKQEQAPERRSCYAGLRQLGDRPEQQDCIAVSDLEDEALRKEKGVLLTLADGMGGMDHGAQVSKLLVETLQEDFRERPLDAAPDAWLLELLGRANRRVNSFLRDKTPGGSTLVMALIQGGRLYHLSVGDSRLYLARGSGLVLLNRQQSYGAKLDLMLVKGILPASELAAHPQRRALTSYVGMGDLEGIDRNTVPLTLQRGDTLLLLTDGVFGTLSEEEIFDALCGDPDTALRRLEHRVRSAGKPYQDNYSAVLYRYDPDC